MKNDNYLVAFIEKANQIHNNKYDYRFITEYINSKTKVKIYCKQCNTIFYQTPNKHIFGRTGCPFCAKNNRVAHNKKTTGTFIKQCIKKHGNKYNYSQVIYVDRNTPVKIKCNNCNNEFLQRPSVHLKGSGCKVCSNQNKSKKMLLNTISFIQACEQKNKHYLYNYDSVKYINAHTPVEIICKKCNQSFFQRPYSHLHNNQGCPFCCVNNISKSEKQWLDEMNVPNDRLHRQVKIILNNQQTFIVDGFDKKTNTVYEFLGDFWHGNPECFSHNKINCLNKKTFGELYQQTMEKIYTLQQHNFNVVYVWEHDWKNKNNN